MANYRVTASSALLAVLGAMFATAPASAAATTPAVRLSGDLVHVADQQGAGSAAIRLPGEGLVPIKPESVKGIASGRAVTVDVVIPADVRVAAAANRTLTTQGVDGSQIAVPLRSSDLAAASDGSPEALTSAIGKATVAEAKAPGTSALEVSRVVAAAADPVSTYTPATRQIYVAVVTPLGATAQPTVDESRIRTQVAGASKYWSDVTGGGVALNVAIIEPQYTSAYTCSDYMGLWNEAATRVGFTGAPNTSLVIELPKGIDKIGASGCGYGLGTIGNSPNDSGYLYTPDDAWPVLAHELGHNMSLMHADALLCPTAADSAYSTTSGWTGAGCTEKAYGDGQDVMSASTQNFAPFLSAPQSLRTGIIAPSAATVIDTVGTRRVTLSPLAGRAGVRAAEVVNPTTGVTYYVEYRTTAAPDTLNVYSAYGVKTGVRVLRYNPDADLNSGGGSTVLLDPSPTGQFRDPDPTLSVGGTFTSYDGAVSITTMSATSANAEVSITTGPPPATAPGAPTTVTATAGDRSAGVSWAAPTSHGGSPVTGYTVTANPGGATATTTIHGPYDDDDPRDTSVTVAGLTNGTSYTFRVVATNAVGAGPASGPSAAVTPRTVPDAPVLVAATRADRSATVSWSSAWDGGSVVTSYTVTASPGGAQVTVGGTRRSATVPGLENGVSYTFTVTAANAAGISPASTVSAPVTPAALPAAPDAVTAVAANRSATVSWTAPPGNDGGPIAGYIVTANPGGATAATTGVSATVAGLTNGTAYTFTVTATNSVGSGPSSAFSNTVVPRDLVGPTVALTGKPPTVTRSTAAQFTFAGADSSDAAATLTYRCSLDHAATVCGSPKSLTNLTSAVHTFTVMAVDPSGNSSFTVSHTWRVDALAPTVSLSGPAAVFTLSSTLVPAWAAKDVGAGVATVDVRWKRAAYSGGFSAWAYPGAWQRMRATRVTLSGAARGYTYCFSTRARDKAGNTSAWSGPRCSAVVLDDRSLAASAGWTRITGATFYAGTARATTSSKKTLTRTRVQTRRIALVATRCARCGTVGIYWNGTLVRRVSLYAATTQRRRMLTVTTFTGVRSGTLSVRSLTSGKVIQVDGLGLSRW